VYVGSCEGLGIMVVIEGEGGVVVSPLLVMSEGEVELLSRCMGLS